MTIYPWPRRQVWPPFQRVAPDLPLGVQRIGHHALVRSGRQRLGFRTSWNIAMSTVSVWSGGVLPFAHAFYWWVCGVPTGKLEQAAQGASPWDRMTDRERHVYVIVTGACVLVIFLALVVVALATG